MLSFDRFLLQHGADRNIMTDEGERPIDLVDSDDFPMIGVMLDPEIGKKKTPVEEEEEEEDEDPKAAKSSS